MSAIGAVAIATEKSIARAEALPDDRVEVAALQILKATDAPLRIVRAPAGFGKSWCLKQLEADMRSDQAAVEWCAPQAVPDVIGEGGVSTVLVDFGAEDAGHHISAFADLVQRHPEARIVVATRRLPELDWARLELDGVAKIIGPMDLTFSVEAIARLFKRFRQIQTGGFRARDLYAATGGWPLAVGLAAKKAESLGEQWAGDVSSLAQPDDYRRFVDSLIIANLPAGIHRTLAQLAGINYISPTLAGQILGRSVEAELSQAQEQFGLVTSVPSQPGFVQLKPLVREAFLKAALAKPDVLEAAGHWYLKNEMPDQAVEHYLSADRADLACEALTESGGQILRTSGDIVRMLRWIDRIASARIELPVVLRLWRCWALTHSQRIEEAAQELELAEAAMAKNPSTADRAYADRLWVAVAARRGEVDLVQEKGEQWLETWRDLEPQSAAGICILMALAKGYYNDELAQRRLLMKAREYAIRCGNHPSNQWILAIEALAELEAGRSKLASEFADRALESCARLCGTETPIFSLLTVLSARVHLELGNTDKAGELFDEGYLATRNYGLPETNLTAQAVRTAVLEQRFGCDAAIAAIHESGLGGGRYGEFGDVLVAELLVRHGRTEEARRRLDLLSSGAAPDDTGNLGQEYRTVNCMILFAEGRYDEANEILTPLLEHADARGQKRRATVLLLLRAACEWQSGREPSAKRFFSRAIAIAATGPLYQTVSNLGWAVKELIARASNRDAANSQANAFVTTLKQQMGLQDEFSELEDREPAIGQLTPREREIVGLLDSTMKVPEIADYLGLGVTTLKWHLRNVYSKLCVSNRSGAVAVARRCAII